MEWPNVEAILFNKKILMKYEITKYWGNIMESLNVEEKDKNVME